MANRRAQFEAELKQKLQQKSTAHSSEETVLLKAFKYFDLNNSGTVEPREWIQAIERLGVTSIGQDVIASLFSVYDVDRSGSLDYKEFSGSIFTGASPAGRSATAGNVYVDYQAAEDALENLRTKLASRGARGIIGLGKQFRIMDDDNSRSVDLYEFTKAIKDYRVDIAEGDIQLIYTAIDRDGSGSVDYDEFLRAVRGPMNSQRVGLVEKAFAKLDADGSGIIDITDVKRFYNAQQHPEVRAGRKTEEDVLNEFLETFETHHAMEGQLDHEVTRDEFLEYYNNVSASIDNDQYFELMMNNTWKLTEAPAYTKKAAWSNKVEEPEDPYQTTSAMHFSPVKQRQAVASGRPAPLENSDVETVIAKVRSKMAGRGTRGIIGLGRLFRIIDDNNSKTIDFEEFKKAVNDYRLELNDREARTLFNHADRDRSGEIDYDEMLRAIRGPMNEFRTGLVRQAYKKLDRDGSGTVDIDDIRGVYSAKSHPDVKSGKKTEEDVLCDFLETFEIHHNISDKALMDHKVTSEEFLEYYNNVSASIDNDNYFETMISAAWKLYGEPVSKEAWAGQYPGREFNTNHRVQFSMDHHRSHFAGSVAKAAPFGTNNDPVSYDTALRPVSRATTSSKPPAGSQSWPGQVQAQDSNETNVNEIIVRFRQKLAQRGARGIIGLSRQFRIMDDNGNKQLEYDEFVKAVKDYRVDVPQDQLSSLFGAFDLDGSGGIDYDEFLRVIRGGMSEFRQGLVEHAFKLIDRTGDGILALEDIKGVYNARNHPDVRMGKKTEDEVLGEFLSTFETHHSIMKGGAGRDQRVDFNEFLEYYNNVSASIDDDRYFELMMKNAWNFDGVKHEKAWSSDQTSPPKRTKYF